ncbi:unnamed protein product [Rhodiola kirilowii]
MRKVKVQPIQSDLPEEFYRVEPLRPPPTRSRFVRLIPNVLLRTSSSEKVCANKQRRIQQGPGGSWDPSRI